MPTVIDGQTYYRTSELCKMAGISKATLFRWLNVGIIGDVVYKDRRGWRLFTEGDIARIKAETSRMMATRSEVIPKPADTVPHILVIDDDPVVGQLFKDTLQKHKYQVTTICDSREALKLITKRHFDLIFLDLKMSEFDGSELLRRVREMDNHAQVAIITGYPNSELMDRAMEQGPILVMKKPFGSDDVLKAVRASVSSAGIMSSKMSSGEV